MESKIAEQLKEYIIKSYDAHDGARTSMWSQGNGDDQFADGENRGTACTLYDIAKIIGLELPPLEVQSFD